MVTNIVLHPDTLVATVTNNSTSKSIVEYRENIIIEYRESDIDSFKSLKVLNGNREVILTIEVDNLGNYTTDPTTSVNGLTNIVDCYNELIDWKIFYPNPCSTSEPSDGDKGDIVVSNFGTTWKFKNADKGDIVISGNGSTMTVDNGVINLAKLGGDITAAGKALLDDINSAAQRVTLGLGNVDNTSDLNKPISTLTQTALNAKQATLVSGTNIKTINSQSLLGSGNITISAPPATPVDLTYTASPTNGIVESSSGTDATIPLVDGTNAGLMSPANFTKLAGIAAGAEVNVNADWNATSGDAQILNKPTIVSSVGATAPITSSGGTNPTISTSMASNRLIGRTTAGSGVMEEITIGTGLQLTAGTLNNTVDSVSVIKHTVKNSGAAVIDKGTPVYSTGSDGTNILVAKASNASESTSSKTMGLTQTQLTTLGSNQTGFVITEGLLDGLNTAGTTAGEPVWLGVDGALIYGLTNKPYAPAHLVFIGIVTKVSAGNGEIFVKVQNGFELQELHNVDLITTTPVNGHILGYDGTLWVNKTIATWLGFTPENVANKSDSYTVSSSTTYSTTKALVDGLATKENTLGFTPENVANKQTDLTASSTKYPTVNAVNTGLSTKEPTITAGTTAQYWRGDKSWQTLDKSAVGLSNVDNTSDANKPVSNATQTALNNKLNTSLKGAINGLAELDGTGKVPAAQLPSYVDDVLEVANFAALPGTGETGKIYVTINTGLTYRWTGTIYAEISSSKLTNLSLDDITASGTINILNDNGSGVSIPLADSLGSGIISASNYDKLTALSTSRQIPPLGSTGQVLGKISGTDYAVGWIDNVVDGSVTFAKMANISNNTLIGRFTAGTGSPESIGIGSGLSNTGTTLYNTLAVGLGSNQTVIGGLNASGTLTLSSTSNATKGKILFGASAYDEANDRLGIGTTSPLTALHVVRDAIAGSFFRMDALNGAPVLQTYRLNGTISLPTGTVSGNIIGLWSMRGHDGTNYVNAARATFTGLASENWTSTAQGTYIRFETTATGTTTLSERLRIDHDGAILIGTTTNSGFKLDVNGTIRSTGDITVPDSAYGASWNGDNTVPTKNAIYDKIETLGGGGGSYTFSTGLTDTAGTVTANLSTGIAGGQSVIGGTAASNNLTLSSTSDATKGKILFGTSAYDEVNNRLGINQSTPTARLQINNNQNSITNVDANGLILANSTPAISGTQSISPPLVLQGNSWSTATSNSNDTRFKIEMIPLQSGDANFGNGQLRIFFSGNGGSSYSGQYTFSSGGTLSASIFSGTFSGSVAGLSTQIHSAGSTSTALFTYRTTNAGSDITPRAYFGDSGSSAGTKTYTLDASTGIGIGAGNGTRQVTRAAIDIANLTNTAGAETGDLIFSTKPSGSAITEKLRITATGNTGINQSTPTSRLHINANQNSVTQNDANGILLANSTAATSGTQSISPPLIIQGNGWGTTPAISQDVRFRVDVLPVNPGSGEAQGTFRIQGNIGLWQYNDNGLKLHYTGSDHYLVMPRIQLTGQFLALSGGTLQYTNYAYRNLNSGGSTFIPIFYAGQFPSTGASQIGIDTTNMLTFTTGNSNGNMVIRAAIGTTSLTNTAGAETGDLIFSTKPSGSAITERLRITSSGNVGVGLTPSTNFEVKGIIRATQTTNSTTNFSQFVHSDAGGGSSFPRASFSLNGSSVTNAGLYVSCGQATASFIPSFLAVSNSSNPTTGGSKQLALYQSSSSTAGIISWTAENAATGVQGSDIFFGGSKLDGSDSAFWAKTTGKIGVNENNPTALFEIKGKGTTSSTSGIIVKNSSSTANFTIRDDGAYAFNGGTVGLAQTGYTTVTNRTDLRTYDVNTATLADIANTLSTLVEDLKAKGIIKA